MLAPVRDSRENKGWIGDLKDIEKGDIRIRWENKAWKYKDLVATRAETCKMWELSQCPVYHTTSTMGLTSNSGSREP